MSDFSANLKHVRTRRGVTQSQLAQRAGKPFTQGLVSLYERGLHPSTGHIQQLAEALDVPVDVLLQRPRLVRRADALQVIVVKDSSPGDMSRKGGPA